MRGKHLNSGIRGGLWDEVHLQRMGKAVWLFGWLVHRQTRERHGVGLVLGGSPLTYEMIREDTGVAARTLKRWMARLVRGGYVRVQHTAHKRMVVEINKAKKFGPQQLGFPQQRIAFPQALFFAPKAKGPLPARFLASKGPIVAHENRVAPGQLAVIADASIAAPRAHRDFESERQKSGARLPAHFSVAQLSQPRANSLYSEANSKMLRDLHLRGELRIGAGPEIHRE